MVTPVYTVYKLSAYTVWLYMHYIKITPLSHERHGWLTHVHVTQVMHERAPVSKDIHLWTHLPPRLQTAHIESSPSLRHVCQRVKQVSQHVNCVYSFIPAPFLLALFSPKHFYNTIYCILSPFKIYFISFWLLQFRA